MPLRMYAIIYKSCMANNSRVQPRIILGSVEFCSRKVDRVTHCGCGGNGVTWDLKPRKSEFKDNATIYACLQPHEPI